MASKLETVEGYLAVPHQLLHVAGYRLAGKKCVYRLGKLYVLPSGSMTRRERLIGTLFPFTVFFSIFLLTTIGTSIALSIYPSTAILSGIYTVFSIGDLRQAYLLLHKKPLSSRTPFDFLLSWRNDLQKADPQLILALLAISALVLTLLFFFKLG
jgi:hypothetical protein